MASRASACAYLYGNREPFEPMFYELAGQLEGAAAHLQGIKQLWPRSRQRPEKRVGVLVPPIVVVPLACRTR